jgi:hypothetical protein
VSPRTLVKDAVSVTRYRDDRFSLPSTGKEAVADVLFAEISLLSVTLGKDFAECISGFAECFSHSAKRLILIVAVEHCRSYSKTLGIYDTFMRCKKECNNFQ